MQQNIVFDISPENSSSSDDEEFEGQQNQNNSVQNLNSTQIISVRAPNLFDNETPQQFQQIAEPIQSMRKQNTVTFDTLNTSDCDKRMLNKWNFSDKENRSKNIQVSILGEQNKVKKQISESVEYLQRQKLQQSLQTKQLPKQKQSQTRKNNVNYSSIENFTSSQMAQELLELDLPALISQLTNKRRNQNSFHNNNNIQISQNYNSLQKPQIHTKQGCIVKQSFGKQNSQIDLTQQTRERSITMIMRQPGKIVNQKQLKSNSIAIRKT